MAKLSDSTLFGTIFTLVVFTTITALLLLQAWIKVKFYHIDPHNVFPASGKAPLKFIDFTDSDGNEAFHRYLKVETFALWMHVFPSLLWGVSTLVQLSPWIRKRFMTLHRISGYTMITTSTVMTVGIMGMMFADNIIYTLPINHWSIFTLFPIICIVLPWFMYSALRGLLAARNKNIPIHKKWMLRHIAAGLSVGLQRGFLGFFGFFFKYLSPVLNKLMGQSLFLTEDGLTDEYRRIGFSYTMWAGAIFCIIGMELQLRASTSSTKTIKVH
jgi:hypothetical protein